MWINPFSHGDRARRWKLAFAIFVVVVGSGSCVAVRFSPEADAALTKLMSYLTSPFDNREIYLIDDDGNSRPITHAEELQLRADGAELVRDNALLRAYRLPASRQAP